MEVGWMSAVVSALSAFVAVGALVASVAEGRAGRRNTEFLGHRDLWWQRWSWVVDRATSGDDRQRDAAAVMASALTTRDWTTSDDRWVRQALEDLQAARSGQTGPHDEGADDDLEPQ